MTTPQKEWKNIQRLLRTIPVEEVAPRVKAWEGVGLWCLVAGELSFVPANGGESHTEWDDPLEYAQFYRWVQARPERVHPTLESAQTFVRGHVPPTDVQESPR